MSRGRRYSFEEEPKLNKKKVIAVIIALLVIIMVIVAINKLLRKDIKSSNKEKQHYYTAFLNGKWGIINSKGEEVILPEYDEMIVVPNSNEDVFICTYDVNYEDGSYKSKAINEKGTQIFGKYEKIEVLQNSDKDNNIWYSKDVLKVYKNGKYGLINYKGKVILKCEYDDIYALQGVNNSFVIVKDNKKGIVDNKAEIVIPTEYAEILPITENYADGYIVKNNEGKFGVVSVNNSQVLQCKYDKIGNITANNMYVAKENSEWKIVTSQGQEYLKGEIDNVKSINGENILIEKDGLFGVVNLSNEIMIPIQYKSLSYAFDDKYVAQKNNKYGLINIKNEKQIEFKYTSMTFRDEIKALEAEKEDYESDIIDKNLETKLTGIISEINEEKSYIKLRDDKEYKYYTFDFEQFANNSIEGRTLFLDKQKEKYGFINKDGIVVVDYIYDDATEQNKYGYSAVKKDGLWGAIDKQGKVIVEPKYEFDNNTIIDFIGEWHLAEDLNANYYTK